MPLAGVLLLGTICFLAGRFSNSKPPAAGAPGISSNSVLPGTSATTAIGNVSASVTAGSPVGPDATTSPGWDNPRWQRLLSTPGTPARNTALADLLEQLAATDPNQSLALANAERNLELRELLVHAALRGWAHVAPADAAHWALALPTANGRENALSAVFTGAVATDPEAAVQLGQSLFQQFPNDAPGVGNQLIDAFCLAGKFELAVRVAAMGDRETRAGWIANAYSKWAEFQPEIAGRAAAAIESPELRNQALHGIVGGWAAVDPVALVNFVLRLPADAEQGAIVSQALERWVREDPKNAAAWISQNESRPELDRGIAAVATMDGIKSDVAIGWAESITSPALRSETLVTVLRNWMTTDLAAAQSYFKTSTNLSPEDRQQLAEVFAGMERQAKP